MVMHRTLGLVPFLTCVLTAVAMAQEAEENGSADGACTWFNRPWLTGGHHGCCPSRFPSG
jgi:hypothetical protein